MHVLLNPSQFLERFRVAAALTPRHGSTPLLESVRLEVAADGRASLRARSHEAELSLSVPVLKVIEPGAAQLPAHDFVKFLGQAKAWSVAIERPPRVRPASAGPGTRCDEVVARVAGESTPFATFDPADFPDSPSSRLSKPTSIRAWRLARLVRQTHAVSNPSATQLALGGCHIRAEDGRLHFVATDGRRLADAFETTGAPTSAPMRTRRKPRTVGSRVVSSKALCVLLQLLECFENETVSLGFTGKGQFRAVADKFAFSARPLEGRFPEWEAIRPASPIAVVAVLDPRTLRRLAEGRPLPKEGTSDVELRLDGRNLELLRPSLGVVARAIVRMPGPSPEGEVSATVRLGDLLHYLSVVRGPFSVAFPREERQVLVFESEGFHYYVMPTERDEPPRAGPGSATDRPSDQPQDGPPPTEQALDIDVLSPEVEGNGADTGEAGWDE